MRGHIYRRGQTWTYMIDVGHDSSGRRRQKSKGGFRTKRDAQAALNEGLNALQRGMYVETSKLTVGKFLRDSWLPAIRSSVRPTTYSSYTMHVRRYLVPALGHIPLQRLSAPQINGFYADLGVDGSLGTSLKPATVRRIHATLHKALRDAVRWQLIPRNPASSADPPRAECPEMAVWTARELSTFLASTADHQHGALWHFYALTGVRRGEALALRWGDVDLDARRATIRRTLVPVDHKLVYGEPKTHKGRRNIALDPDLVDRLRAHRRRQAGERLLVGPGYKDEDLVFAHPDGTPLHPEQVSRWFAARARSAGLPPIRLHDLRHTHATLALVAGVATRVVSDRLGHSATAVTADIYQHVLPDLDDDAAVRVAMLVRGSDRHDGESPEEPDEASSALPTGQQGGDRGVRPA